MGATHGRDRLQSSVMPDRTVQVDTLETAVPSAGGGPRLLQAVPSMVGLVTLTGIAFGVAGVGVRWISFFVWREGWPLLAYAPVEHPVDILFLGARTLLSPSVVIVLIALAFALWISRGDEPWHRTLDARSAAIRDLERLNQRVETDLGELARSLVDPAATPRMAERPIGRLQDAQERSRVLIEAIEASDKAMDSNRVHGFGREYPIRTLGVAFSTKQVFALFLGIGLFSVASLVALVPFPSGFVLQISLYVGFGMAIYGAFWTGRRRIPWLIASVLVVSLGAVVAGAITYRLPVAAFDASTGAALQPGRYAIVGSSDMATFLLACDNPSSGVVAVRVQPAVLTFEASGGAPLEPPLLEAIIAPRATTRRGPMAGCG